MSTHSKFNESRQYVSLARDPFKSRLVKSLTSVKSSQIFHKDCQKCETLSLPCNPGHVWLLWTPAIPVYGVLPLQYLTDLLPAALLVLWMTGQTVEEPGDATSRGVVALEHECVHLSSDVLVRKALLVLILPTGAGSVNQ